jgi:hypothetical protein
MKRLLTILIVPFLMGSLATPASADGTDNGPPYGWTLSSSATDPFRNTDTFIPGLLSVYLWYVCSTSAEDGGPGGMAAAQFSIINKQPANIFLAFTAQGGFLNAGPPPGSSEICALLAVGGCPVAQDGSGTQGPILAGVALLLNNAPGALGFQPCDGVKGTVDCSPNPLLWDMQWIGLSYDGTDPQSKDWDKCQPKPVSVEDSSWGQIKGLYR